MDAIVVGALTAVGTVTGMVLWLLLARPDALLGLWSDPTPGGWFDENPGTVEALRITLAALLVVLGFVTGAAVAFLAATR